ncbi:MAG: metal-dependent hydrolase [Candidatus Heimdallarchaeaceae archaeon]
MHKRYKELLFNYYSVQGGFHLLVGLVLASLWNRQEYKFAVVLGSILPDFDIFIVGVVYLIAGEDAAMNIHRSFTHSLFSIGVIMLVCLSLHFLTRKKETVNFDFLGLAVGLGLGMTIHSILDLFYLSYVRLFWPFSMKKISYAFVRDTILPTLHLKLLQVTDFYTDIFFFHLPLVILAFKKDLLKRLRWYIVAFLAIDFAITTFFVVFAFNSTIGYTDYVIYLYYPGTFFLLFSVFSPFIYRKMIVDFAFDKGTIIIIVALLAFSQLLFVL